MESKGLPSELRSYNEASSGAGGQSPPLVSQHEACPPVTGDGREQQGQQKGENQLQRLPAQTSLPWAPPLCSAARCFSRELSFKR